ncbi:MAG: PilZ domain-containing protein [Treponema sp.]|nr:PilZ domain-containing protein [Treponema sp.]
MFFKKKKDELNDQLAVYRERQSARWGKPKYNIDAGITISGFEGEGQVGNVSLTGCSMMSVTYINIIPGEVYKLKFIPAQKDNMKPFNLSMKLNWIKSSETLFLAGFELEGATGGEHLKQYVEILRSYGIEPDYGNMSAPQS